MRKCRNTVYLICPLAALAAAVLLLALLEHRAEQLQVGRFRYYTPAELQAVLKESAVPAEAPRRPLLLSRPEDAMELLTDALPPLANG